MIEKKITGYDLYTIDENSNKLSSEFIKLDKEINESKWQEFLKTIPINPRSEKGNK